MKCGREIVLRRRRSLTELVMAALHVEASSPEQLLSVRKVRKRRKMETIKQRAEERWDRELSC